VVEDQDRLEDDVRIDVLQEPEGDPEAPPAAELEDLEAEVSQDRVRVVPQVVGELLVGEDGGAGAERPLADARARVAGQA